MAEYKQYAKLGSIEFSPLNGFTSFSKKESSNYAEHQLLNSKSVLQPTGENLKEISGTMRLFAHAMGHTSEDFTQIVSIEQRLIQLRLYRANNSAVEFVWGNGNSEGYYVITEVEENIIKQFPDGTKLVIDVTVKMKEYFEPDPLKREQAQNRAAAPAVGNKKSNAVNKKTNSKTCPQLIADQASKINMYAAAINELSTNYGIAVSPVKNIGLKNHLWQLKNICNELTISYTKPESCIYANEKIKNSAIDLIVQCDSFTSLFNQQDPTSMYSAAGISIPIYVPIENVKLQDSVGKLKVVLLPLLKIAITRGG